MGFDPGDHPRNKEGEFIDANGKNRPVAGKDSILPFDDEPEPDESQEASANMSDMVRRLNAIDDMSLRTAAFTTLVEDGVTDFSGIDLHGANLNGRRLRKLWLTDANLADANLDGTDLTNSYFHGANLDRATIRRGKTGGTNFVKASMRKADLSHTNFGESMWGGDYYEEPVVPHTTFEDTDLEGARLDGTCSLMYTDMTGASLRDTTADEAQLAPYLGRGLDLRGAKWTHGIMNLPTGANLTGGSFRNMVRVVPNDTVRNADLCGSRVGDGDYVGCDMRGTFVGGVLIRKLRNCDLRDSQLKYFPSETDLRGSRFERCECDTGIAKKMYVKTDLDPEGKKILFDPRALGITPKKHMDRPYPNARVHETDYKPDDE